ncbi:GNAT family N-acetyltransferase [Aureivirga sp. CE67]|uniref:GNAT family N-acetyltransferase n=1 Tax=Aureivirga sp. CE67 TaxID=1788983 RepID=UPI0018CAE1D9|nr:GNAT family N-acetyltransferase [Aureivirga sp. CE67]
MVHLRKATLEDIPGILEILNYEILNRTAIYFYEARTLAQQIEWFEEKLEQKFPVLVAVKNEQIVGFGSFGKFRPKPAYQFTVEHSVYVSKDFQGLGIGKILLEELILIAKNDNYHSMIGVIDANNKSSIAFHEKFGFKEVGVLREVGYKFDTWLDISLMQLVLKSSE